MKEINCEKNGITIGIFNHSITVGSSKGTTINLPQGGFPGNIHYSFSLESSNFLDTVSGQESTTLSPFLVSPLNGSLGIDPFSGEKGYSVGLDIKLVTVTKDYSCKVTDKVDADDATKGKYEGSLDSAEQSYKDYTRPKNTGSSGSNSPGDDPKLDPPSQHPAPWGGAPIVLDLDGDGQVELINQEGSTAFYDFDGDGLREQVGWASGDVAPSGMASHEPLPIISGAALGGDEVVIHSLSLSRVASSSPTQTILRVA